MEPEGEERPERSKRSRSRCDGSGAKRRFRHIGGELAQRIAGRVTDEDASPSAFYLSPCRVAGWVAWACHGRMADGLPWMEEGGLARDATGAVRCPYPWLGDVGADVKGEGSVCAPVATGKSNPLGHRCRSGFKITPYEMF